MPISVSPKSIPSSSQTYVELQQWTCWQPFQSQPGAPGQAHQCRVLPHSLAANICQDWLNADTAPDMSHRATVHRGAAFLMDEKMCCVSRFPYWWQQTPHKKRLEMGRFSLHLQFEVAQSIFEGVKAAGEVVAGDLELIVRKQRERNAAGCSVWLSPHDSG